MDRFDFFGRCAGEGFDFERALNRNIYWRSLLPGSRGVSDFGFRTGGCGPFDSGLLELSLEEQSLALACEPNIDHLSVRIPDKGIHTYQENLQGALSTALDVNGPALRSAALNIEVNGLRVKEPYTGRVLARAGSGNGKGRVAENGQVIEFDVIGLSDIGVLPIAPTKSVSENPYIMSIVNVESEGVTVDDRGIVLRYANVSGVDIGEDFSRSDRVEIPEGYLDSNEIDDRTLEEVKADAVWMHFEKLLVDGVPWHWGTGEMGAWNLVGEASPPAFSIVPALVD